MKDIIKFLEENNCNNYSVKEYPNGGVKVTVEVEEEYHSYELCKKAEKRGLHAESLFYKAFIYDDKGYKEFERRFFKLVTVEEMQSVTSKLIELGFGEYSVLCKVPFNADALMYSSWDAYAFESSAISSNSIYLDLAEYSNQVMLPDNLLELAEKINPNQNCKNGRGLNVKTFDKVLLDLISEGLADYYIFRTSFEDKDDKYEVFTFGEVVETTEECVYFSLEKV
jgi:hypothetical protein